MYKDILDKGIVSEDDVNNSKKQSKKSNKDRKYKQDNKDRKSDRDLKKKYAKYFIIIVFMQLILINEIFIMVGAGIIHYDGYSLDIFVTATIIQVFLCVKEIIRNLFPNGNSKK